MWHKIRTHIHNAIQKGKEHVKHLSDFGQNAWTTVGNIVKETAHGVNNVNAYASNFQNMHPVIDSGIGFLNQFTSGVNHAFDWYMNADEKKNTIEQSFKEKTTGLDAVSRASDATNRAFNASVQPLTRRSAM